MLPFRKPEAEAETPPPRWNIGMDRRQVATCVGLALLAGFGFGYFTGRQTAPAPKDTPAALAAGPSAPDTPRPATPPDTNFRPVTKILRADTVEVEGVGPVRMLGVETPDGKPQYAAQGRNALAYTEKLLLGQEVRLEYDEANAARGHKDEQGQALAYLYARDGRLVNGELIRQGHAFVRVGDPFRRAEEFRAFEREAALGMRGLWGADDPGALAAAPPGQPPRPGRLTPLSPSEVGPNLPALTNPPSGAAPASTSPAEPTVLVSAADRTYHKAGCELLGKGRRATGLAQARGEGYAACSRCYPSTSLKVR